MSPDECGQSAGVSGAAGAKSYLAVAVSYWPGRWSRAVVIAGIALEPFVGALDPIGWTALLDRLSVAVANELVDETRFPPDDDTPTSSTLPR